MELSQQLSPTVELSPDDTSAAVSSTPTYVLRRHNVIRAPTMSLAAAYIMFVVIIGELKSRAHCHYIVIGVNCNDLPGFLAHCHQLEY